VSAAYDSETALPAFPENDSGNGKVFVTPPSDEEASMAVEDSDHAADRSDVEANAQDRHVATSGAHADFASSSTAANPDETGSSSH
jgi:hypothetical protein